MIPVFKNRKNKAVTLSDGEVIWNSRSCAVVAQICLFSLVDHTWYILLGQRGTGTPDFQGYWGLPCGYLDWDETLCEAVIREVWEECGLYLPELSTNANFVDANSSLVSSAPFSDEPWSITDKTDNTKQNISMHYAVFIGWKGEFPVLSNAFSEPNEVDNLAWVPMQKATQLVLAFDHHKRITKLLTEQQQQFALFAQRVLILKS